MPRDFRETIKEILPLIPVDTPDPEDDYSELKRDLEEIGGAWYAAAEIEGPALWMGAAGMLEEWLGEPKPVPEWPEWKWQVLSVFTGIPFTC